MSSWSPLAAGGWALWKVMAQSTKACCERPHWGQSSPLTSGHHPFHEDQAAGGEAVPGSPRWFHDSPSQIFSWLMTFESPSS